MNFTSAADALEYAARHSLPRLGSGVSRTTYALPDPDGQTSPSPGPGQAGPGKTRPGQRVLKISHRPTLDLDQSNCENYFLDLIQTAAPPDISRHFPRLYAHGPGWSIQERIIPGAGTDELPSEAIRKVTRWLTDNVSPTRDAPVFRVLPKFGGLITWFFQDITGYNTGARPGDYRTPVFCDVGYICFYIAR